MKAIGAVLYTASVAGLAAGFGAAAIRPGRRTVRAGLAAMAASVLLAGLAVLLVSVGPNR